MMKRVLLHAKDETIHDLAQTVLAIPGLALTIVRSVAEALHLLTEVPPFDVVILGSFERKQGSSTDLLIRYLRSNQGCYNIIALSASSDDLAEMMSLGCRAGFLKPFPVKALVELVLQLRGDEITDDLYLPPPPSA